MLFVLEQGGRSFMELAEVQDGWGWCSDMVGSMLEIGSGNFGMLVLDNAEGMVRNVADYAEPIASCG
jgi:hypothetical protein